MKRRDNNSNFTEEARVEGEKKTLTRQVKGNMSTNFGEWVKRSLQPSLQKLHKPQWQAQAHQIVYRDRVCFVWGIYCELMNLSAHFLYLIK